jgi:hypothetical protein
MHFLILLLLGLTVVLYFTFRLWRRSDLRRYLVLLLIIDGWLSIVLFYLFYSAIFN